MAEDGESRRSKVVGLSVLGLVATVVIADKALPQDTEMRRNVYADRAACERDYPPSQCQSPNPGGGSWAYHGPYYSANRSTAAADDPGPGRAVATRISYETSYRGGFGAFGRAVHAVG
jgi:hypothetical protein